MLPEAPQPRVNAPSRVAMEGPPGAAFAAVGGMAAPGLVHTQQVARAPALALENTLEHRSLRRARRCSHRTITGARLLDESVRRGGQRGRWLFITATYRDDVQWESRHWSDFMHCVRQWYRRQRVPLRYRWVMELTKRGRPHYHLLLWVPRHLMLPKPDSRGWWRHGLTKTETARNPVGYLAKYASKLADANNVADVRDDGSYEWRRFPRHARICGGSLLKGELGVEWRYWIAPRWLRDQIDPLTDVRRCPVGGGWYSPTTGEWWASPWRYVGKSPCGKFLLFDENHGPIGCGRQ